MSSDDVLYSGLTIKERELLKSAEDLVQGGRVYMKTAQEISGLAMSIKNLLTLIDRLRERYDLPRDQAPAFTRDWEPFGDFSRRLRVPSGWVVSYDSYICFVYDPEGEWIFEEEKTK